MRTEWYKNSNGMRLEIRADGKHIRCAAGPNPTTETLPFYWTANDIADTAAPHHFGNASSLAEAMQFAERAVGL